MNKITVLDCTLRDGGYYCNWEYGPDLVRNYLKSVDDSGIDVIEIGLRTPPKNDFLGPFAYCTDDFLLTLDLPKKCRIAVMINGKDFISLDDHGTSQLIHKYFSHKKNSPVSMVRIAIHFEEIPKTKQIVSTLKTLGYSVGLNLMQAGTKSDKEIQDAAHAISEWGSVDVLYFADSLGNMQPDDIISVTKSLRTHWKSDIGIHTHNNMGMALLNTMTALSHYTSWFDATVLGMGRGAGNAKMEHLLIELVKLGYTKYVPESLFSIVLNDFKHLQRKYEWGENLPYYLAAAHKIHPTYIQEMLSDTNCETHHLISALSNLKSEDSKSYSSKQLKKAMEPSFSNIDGTWSPKSLSGAEKVLILANGPQLQSYSSAIANFIKKYKPLVLSLNINKFINPELISAYVVCNQMRFSLESDLYKDLNRPIIMPLNAAPMNVIKQASNLTIFDYGLSTDGLQFECYDKKCILKSSLALPYALSVCQIAKTKKIFLAGFDGLKDFGAAKETQEVFDHFGTFFSFVAITPSDYDIPKRSVYAPMEY